MKRSWLFLVIFLAPSSGLAEVTPEQSEFFETRIRPVLAENCYLCHGDNPEKIKGGLNMLEPGALLRGGDSGWAAIVPGDPDKSLLILGIRRGDPSFQMPPNEALPAHVIADFERWVEMGAFWPESGNAEAVNGNTLPETDHGTSQPIEDSQPPPVEKIAEVIPEQSEFFETKIRPVLMGTCFECHGGEKPKSGFRVDDREHLMHGGDSGEAAIVPGEPDKSRLVLAIRRGDPNFQMPPKEALPDEVIADFVRWIEMGAIWPDSGNVEADYGDRLRGTDHWAFKPRQDPQPPPVKKGEWIRSPLDRFILAKLEEKGLDPAPPVEKRILIRRATFDLIGLPPTPEEIQAFLEDESPDAYEKLIERLLDSPHYGERWGRHWLDLVRYADTTGDNTDMPIPEAHKYRDYVIKSFNEDLPYDQFIVEQIAGDILAFENPDPSFREKIIATGFVALAQRFRSSDYHLMVDNAVDTVGKSMLGLSLTCARCHDHKFDPITQRDYYGIYGFFKNARYPHAGSDEQRFRSRFVPLVKDREFTKEYDKAYQERWKLQDELQKLERQYEDMLKRDPAHLEENVEKVRAFISLLESDDEPPPRRRRFNPERSEAEKEDHEEELLLVLAKRRLGEAETVSETYSEAKRTEVKEQITETEQGIEERRYLDDIELAYGVIEDFDEPTDEPIHIRGDPKNKGDLAPRGFIRFITPEDPVIPEGQSGRLQFAEWVASPENPMTARVMANRIWQYHFGRGIVSTSSVFGNNGQPPTHPELLDWLASRFVEKGWSIKAMHRLIMLSSTYRTSSRENDSYLQLDPSNFLLARFPKRRLEAEPIRDSILAVSGTLDRTLYGEHPFPKGRDLRFDEGRPFAVDYEHNHRSVYLVNRRFTRHQWYELFNGPDTKRSTPNRRTSAPPQQALFLMNNPLIKEASEAFAERLLAERDTDPDRVRRAFMLAYARDPSETEINDALDYLQEIGHDQSQSGIDETESESDAWASFCRIIFMSNEFIFVE